MLRTQWLDLHTGNGHGSTNTKIRRFATLVDDIGNVQLHL